MGKEKMEEEHNGREEEMGKRERRPIYKYVQYVHELMPKLLVKETFNNWGVIRDFLEHKKLGKRFPS